MKFFRRFFASLFICVILLTFNIPQSFAHCHQLSDPIGDSGSSHSFTDIVATELSNEGDSIGVRISTNGNIPNGLGSTGELAFALIFPGSLLSADPQDIGANVVTIHWTPEIKAWEGSQFVYKDGKITPLPWPAKLTLDGKTASFSIPKKLIGKGILAYQAGIFFESDEGTASDITPSEGILSDCATTISQETSSQTPKKEGDTIIDPLGSQRVINEDVGKSLALIATPSKISTKKSPISPTLVVYQSPAEKLIITPNTMVSSSNRPSGLIVGLVVIFLTGVVTTASVSYFKNQLKVLPPNCDHIRRQIEELNKKIASLREKLKDLGEKVKAAKEQVEKARVKAADIARALKNHLKNKRPSGDDYMDYEGKRHHMKDYGYKTGADVYDEKTKELEKLKTQADTQLAHKEEELGKIELELETERFILETSEKTLQELEKALVACERRIAPTPKPGTGMIIGGPKSSGTGIAGQDDTPNKDRRGEEKCTEGDIKESQKFICSFLIPDQSGFIEFKSNFKSHPHTKGVGQTGAGADIISKLLRLLGLIIGVATSPENPLKLPLGVINLVLTPVAAGGGAALDVVGRLLPQKLFLTEIVIDALRINQQCEERTICLGGRWVKEVNHIGSSPSIREKVTIPFEEVAGMRVEDLADFLKKEFKRRFADPAQIEKSPCTQCQTRIDT